MRLMTIDIGTNSTLYLIAEIVNNKIKLLDRGIVGNSLGAMINSNSVINQRLMEKNRLILRNLANKANEFNCVRTGAVGTHALREAVNGNEFIKMAEGEDVDLKIISDENEANLAWRGVFGSNGSKRQTALLDLGGGSTEIIVGEGNQREYFDSIPLGAVTLTRNYFKHDPPQNNEIIAAKDAVHEVFRKWSAFKDEDFTLVGIAGTITALAAIIHQIMEYNPGRLDGLTLEPEDVKRLTKRLLLMNLHEREQMPGMPSARASSIHAGALMFDVIQDTIGRKTITVSERGVLFGLAEEIAEQCG